MDYASILLNSASPVPIPNTPSNLVHYPRPTQAERLDDSGPYKAEMLSRMETLQRGDRVLPPCDRCRRLHMDCLKNLTACQGCTRKHAKCSWKDVTEQELIDHPRVTPKEENPVANGEEAAPTSALPRPEGPPQPVRDEELLGEDDSDDDMHRPAAVAHRGGEMERSGSASGGEAATLPRQLDGADESSVEPGAGDAVPPDRMELDKQETEMAKEDIQAVARDILSKRLVEMPAVNASSGFEPVEHFNINRPSSASTPEVRIYEPPQDLQTTGKENYRSPDVELYGTEEIKPSKPEGTWGSYTTETSNGLNYGKPYD